MQRKDISLAMFAICGAGAAVGVLALALVAAKVISHADWYPLVASAILGAAIGLAFYNGKSK
jgi:hypothetical protein